MLSEQTLTRHSHCASWMASNASAVRAAGFDVKNTISRLMAVCSSLRIAAMPSACNGDDKAALVLYPKLSLPKKLDNCTLQSVETTANRINRPAIASNRGCILFRNCSQNQYAITGSGAIREQLSNLDGIGALGVQRHVPRLKAVQRMNELGIVHLLAWYVVSFNCMHVAWACWNLLETNQR